MNELQAIYSFLKKEIESLNTKFINEPWDNHKLVKNVAKNILFKGKRMRPILLFLVFKLLNGKETENAINMAYAIELIHTASLLHDDVIDEASTRRGKKTANHIWGNKETILVGDYFFTKSFLTISALNNTNATQILANASANLTNGEITQLAGKKNASLSLQEYRKIIYRKTAALFEAASHLGGVLAMPNNANVHQECMQFGKSIGLAFQMVDDILDYTGKKKKTGKTVGIDFTENKVTLPVILLLQNAEKEEVKLVKNHFSGKKTMEFTHILKMMHRHDIFNLCYKAVEEETKNVHKFVTNYATENSKERSAITTLLWFLASRQM